MINELKESWPTANRYFLSHSVGLPPKNVDDAIAARLLAPWQAANDEVWPQWLARTTEFRASIAALLNHDAQFVCPQNNVSTAVTKILGALPEDRKRQTLLLSERAFPSLGFVFQQAERSAFDTRLIGQSFDTQNLQTWEQHLTPDVRAVLLTHVHSNTGECHDLRPVCELARERGIVTIIDVAQSIGAVATDVQAWQADFVVGSCVKWLCGGPGAGFLWINPNQLEACKPSDVGWFSHSNPFEFDIHHFEYADDATRFWGGTPSVAPFVIASNSIEQLFAAGLEKVRNHNRALLAKIDASIDAKYHRSPLEADKRGGTVVLNFGDAQEAVCQRLSQAGFQFDQRVEGIRLSPHFYNDVADVQRLIDCITRL